MNRRTLIFVQLIATLSVTSCQVPEIVELPKNPPKLVLNVVSEDSVKWRAKLSVSKGVLELPPFETISDATIRIFEDGQLLEQLQFVDNSGSSDYYETLLTSPMPGKTYLIEANSASYPTVSAEYRHPSGVPIDAFQVETLGFDNATGAYSMRFLVTYQDPQGNNFYSLSIVYKTNDSPFPDGSGAITLFFSNPAYEENERVFQNSIVLSDQAFDGLSVTLEFEAIMTYFPGEGPEDYPFYTVSLQNMSEGLYNYAKAVYIQGLTQGEPFAQPIIVANNITNGFGIFGGFTETERTTKVE